MAPAIFIALAAGLVFLLGAVHLIYTFYGPKLTPRDQQLTDQMSRVSPVIAKETDMWKCWIGFNASHSLGAILFGLAYGYLAISHPKFLFASYFLLAIGLGFLASLAVLAKLYWFSIPFRGITIAFAAYLTGLILHFT